MLVFGLIWFSGVLYYARHASEQDEDSSSNRHNPKHGAHVEKREHSKYLLFNFKGSPLSSKNHQTIKFNAIYRTKN